MATVRKLQKLDCSTNMLDLPEQVFREIFRYLDFETVYFTLRKVCPKIKEYVDGFIQLGGMFMLAAGRDVLTEILYIFKQCNKETTIYSKSACPYPYPPIGRYSYSHCSAPTRTIHHQYPPTSPVSSHTRQDFYLGSFGAIFNKKIVIGVYYFHGHTGNIKFNMHHFDPIEYKWTCFQQNGSHFIEGNTLIQSWSPISDSELVLFLVNYSDCHSCLQLLHLDMNSASNSNDRPIYSSCRIELPHQLEFLTDCTLVSVANNKILLIGGIQHPDGINEGSKPNQRLWQGTLTTGGQDVTWLALSIKMNIGQSIKMRLNPICFKLKDNVYIAGGKRITHTTLQTNINSGKMPLRYTTKIIDRMRPFMCNNEKCNKCGCACICCDKRRTTYSSSEDFVTCPSLLFLHPFLQFQFHI